MKKPANYNDKKALMEKLQAFALFHSEGLKAVKQTYPEHVEFVLENKAKTYKQVKYELFPAMQEH
jgi:hypothetical protein